MEKFLSRKFALAVMSVVACSTLMYYGKIADGVYATIMVATLTGFFTANVVEKKV